MRYEVIEQKIKEPRKEQKRKWPWGLTIGAAVSLIAAAFFYTNNPKPMPVNAEIEEFRRILRWEYQNPIDEYKKEKKRYPESLYDPEFRKLLLTTNPNFLRDPFNKDKSNLKYDPIRGIVYSVGPDEIDNGGVPYNQKTKKGDILSLGIEERLKNN